jgi:hypothetical protein
MTKESELSDLGDGILALNIIMVECRAVVLKRVAQSSDMTSNGKQ